MPDSMSNTCRRTISPNLPASRPDDLDVAMEIWATPGKDAMDEATATGKVDNLGETGMIAIEEWWYPEYMKEKCPGLPDWEALKKCAGALLLPPKRRRRAATSAAR